MSVICQNVSGREACRSVSDGTEDLFILLEDTCHEKGWTFGLRLTDGEGSPVASSARDLLGLEIIQRCLAVVIDEMTDSWSRVVDTAADHVRQMVSKSSGRRT